jgi:bacterioferritin-associated ferredoxin
MAKKPRPTLNDPLVCFCNEVPRSAIDRAIACGACTLAQLFDATFAGCGPCGGSCQPHLVHILGEALAAAELAQRPAVAPVPTQET